MTLTPTETPTQANAGLERGRIGIHLASGQVVMTATGRETTPFPKVDVSTPRRTTNTLQRADVWLIANARAEAAATGVPFHVDATGPWPQADKDLAELILFGH